MQQQLGQTIKKYRNKKGYTLIQLADKLQISIGLLSNIENSKTDSFQLKLLNNIIQELDIPLEELKIFSKSYPIEKLDMFSIDLNKMKDSLEKLINSFITTASELSFNENQISLMTDILITQLNLTSKFIEATKSK